MPTFDYRGSPIICGHYPPYGSESHPLGPCHRDRLCIDSISINYLSIQLSQPGHFPKVVKLRYDYYI